MKVRFPPELKDQIAEAAKTNGRTMNAEIVNQLELTFSGGGMPSDVGLQLAEIHQRLAQLEQIIADKLG